MSLITPQSLSTELSLMHVSISLPPSIYRTGADGYPPGHGQAALHGPSDAHRERRHHHAVPAAHRGRPWHLCATFGVSVSGLSCLVCPMIVFVVCSCWHLCVCVYTTPLLAPRFVP